MFELLRNRLVALNGLVVSCLAELNADGDARSTARVYMSVSPTRFATRSTTERSSTCWRVRPQGNRATTTRVQRRSIDSSARAQYPCLVSVSPAIAHSGGLSFATSAAGWSAYWLSHLVRGAW